MTGIILIDKLAEMIREDVQHIELKTKGGLIRSPRVFTQYLPLPKTPKVKPRDADQEAPNHGEYGPQDFEDNFPCVIVKMGDWKYDDRQATIRVRFLIGIYDESPDCQGFRDVCNVADRIALILLENQTVDRRYLFRKPLAGLLFLDQPWPVYFGELSAEYALNNPAEIIKRMKGDWRDGTYPTKPEPR